MGRNRTRTGTALLVSAIVAAGVGVTRAGGDRPRRARGAAASAHRPGQPRRVT
ncbi:hypothetical protein GA0070618_6224 [Micromonospora echinospora]|uniref:Uncharacterized protein n=1 Tax=Micromonospora echinospora TaxID=1877 RepID=A0A1C5A3A0_MICEC|nr:hypothetical protein [Micromonospora echinospora]SCF39692.1 hypothetical protein GA0070618_6224 [Micromonospora echinospora]